MLGCEECFSFVCNGQRDRDDRYSWVDSGGTLRTGPRLVGMRWRMTCVMKRGSQAIAKKSPWHYLITMMAIRTATAKKK